MSPQLLGVRRNLKNKKGGEIISVVCNAFGIALIISQSDS